MSDYGRQQGLGSAIKERPFREDLYYRLKVIHIQTPSLREVPEDIPVLANHFLSKYCKVMNTDLKEFTPEALDLPTRHPWPGNAPQLENEVKRLVASVRGQTITQDRLDTSIRNSHKTDDPQKYRRPPVLCQRPLNSWSAS